MVCRVTEIQQLLSRVERDPGVRVLHACESGSRAWGFASTDSDYDSGSWTTGTETINPHATPTTADQPIPSSNSHSSHEERSQDSQRYIAGGVQNAIPQFGPLLPKPARPEVKSATSNHRVPAMCMNAVRENETTNCTRDFMLKKWRFAMELS